MKNQVIVPFHGPNRKKKEKRERHRTASGHSAEGLDLGVDPGKLHQRMPSPYELLLLKLEEKEAHKRRVVEK